MRLAQFRRAEELFHGAAGLPRDRLRAWLARECSDDPEVRAEVERLLDEDREGKAADSLDGIRRDIGTVVQRAGNRRWYALRHTIGQSSRGPVHLVLRPNPALAVGKLQTWEIWGEEIKVEIPIAEVD